MCYLPAGIKITLHTIAGLKRVTAPNYPTRLTLVRHLKPADIKQLHIRNNVGVITTKGKGNIE